MSDLIDRQAAIDALEKVAELYPWRVPGDRDSYSQYNEAWQDALNRADSEIEALPSVQPLVIHCTDCDDWLERQSTLGFTISGLPSVQPERLTDDDFETIRIHLNAYKEKLCNQQRWKEAEEYQRIIDRFMAFTSVQPETHDKRTETHACDLISRQAAIDMCRKPRMRNADCSDFEMEIMMLPSAQPEIIRCKDCKYWIPGYITDQDDLIPPKCGKYQQMVGHSSSDYCSLAEAKEDIDE